MFCSKGTDKRLHLLKFSELYPNVMHAMMFQPHHQTSKWWIIKCKWGKCTQFKRRWGQLLWIVIASLTSDVFLLWKVQQITKVSKYVVRLSCWPSLPFWWICICRKSFNASRQKIHWFLHFFLSTKVHNCYLGQLQNFQNFQRCPSCSEEGKSLHFLTPILSKSCFASGIEANYIYSMIWHDLGIIFIPTRFDIRMRLNWNLSVCRPLWW